MCILCPKHFYMLYAFVSNMFLGPGKYERLIKTALRILVHNSMPQKTIRAVEEATSNSRTCNPRYRKPRRVFGLPSQP